MNNVPNAGLMSSARNPRRSDRGGRTSHNSKSRPNNDFQRSAENTKQIPFHSAGVWYHVLMVALPIPPTPTPPPASLTRFAPSESLTDQLFSQLADPAQSLLSIARDNNTTPEAFSLWLSRPEISERIAAMRSASALRTRWLASEHLPSCAELASRIVRAALNSSEAPPPDSALRAARFLFRLCSFDPDARVLTASAPKPRHAISSPDTRPDPSPISSVHSAPSDPSDLFVPSDSPPDTPSSLNLPPHLLASILPSFDSAERNPFLPDPGLLKTAPNQRALVKMRLKQQRNQIIDRAFQLLLQHALCTSSDLPRVRHEIESFYLLQDPGRSPSSSPTRAPPTFAVAV